MIASTKLWINFHFPTSQPIKTLRKRLPNYFSRRVSQSDSGKKVLPAPEGTDNTYLVK